MKELNNRKKSLETTVFSMVGAGPRFLYSFERIAAIIAELHRQGRLERPVEIHIYDPSGQFGPGSHDAEQADSNWLNVIARHISRVPDETVKKAQLNLYPSIIPQQRLYEFIRNDLGDTAFDPDDYPERKKLGAFLTKAVNDIEAALKTRNVPLTIHRHAETVVDIEKENDCTRRIISKDAHGNLQSLSAHSVLLTTGHTRIAALSEQQKSWRAYANEARKKGNDVHYIPPNLEVRESMSLENVPPQSTIGMEGEGLDTIDKILHLTEGRGGRFFRDETGTMHYQPSGKEPQKIITFSDSNLMVYSKGRNEKK